MPRPSLTPKHAATLLGLSTSRLVQLEAQGQLTSIRDSAAPNVRPCGD